MKKFINVGAVALSATLAFASVNATAGGVPVIDVSNLAQAVAQVQNSVQQIQSLERTYNSVRGATNIGSLLNDANIRKTLNKYLPNGYTDIYQAMQKGDLGALTQVYNGVLQNEKNNQNNSAVTGKQRLASTMILNQANMQAMMNGLNQREANIQTLMNAIQQTPDPKQKQDLANRLAGEQASINVTMNKMQVMLKINEQNEKLALRQSQAETQKRIWK
ncbi:hypothetical protein A9299_10105 [Moraxella osloensis]|uniref:P-type DNA transfer protein VirB5 n=1 Tax=Faucicola osloensis TaxID=34062 RepID=A0AA91FT41_FAUOS|nr:type IV secretion system protein [Moraxella osloensis]OBX64349.1 hypothetical protein A9299_10105 [Moraxella osloensis]